jgi:arylsulfatase A-like enzyme
LTGRHPYRYGIKGANSGHIRPQELLLPEILKEHGYTTGHFGKWHLGVMSGIVIESNRGGYSWSFTHYAPPWENGFDRTFSTEAKSPTWDPMINPSHQVGGSNKDQEPGDSYGTYYWTGKGCLATENLEGDDSRVIMDRAISFMRSAVDQNMPFFSVIWFHTPHSPVIAGDEYRRIYEHLSEEKQHYYGCITAMDEQIGRLREELGNLGVADNTMVWFCSDNGPAAEGGGPGLKAGGRQQGKTGGLRERKGSLFEGGVRVPALLEWPGGITEHRVIDIPCSTSDYLPTILDLLGIRPDQPVEPLDGISLLPVIRGEKTERDSPIGFIHRNQRSLVDDRYKLYSRDNGETYSLFDLLEDPGEEMDIIGSEPEIASRMMEELNVWLGTVQNSSEGKDY